MSARQTLTPQASIHRLLPQSPDSEKALLSSFMLVPGRTAEICDEWHITADCFHIPAHAAIYSVLREQHEAGRAVDLITLAEFLRSRQLLEFCGGPAFVAELLTFIPTAANAAYYAEILHEKFTRREVIRTCTELAAGAYEEDGEADALLEESEVRMLAIRRGNDSGLRELSPLHGSLAAVQAIESIYERRGEIQGLSTGFPDLDRMTDGFHGSEMIVIAARPSMGKTALAMNMAHHIALDLEKPVAFFSAEMSAEQLHLRLLLSAARLNPHRMRHGVFQEGEFERMRREAVRISRSRLFIVDAVGATIGRVAAKARRMHRQHGLAAIFVDYLQLLRSRSAQAERNREREISEISQGLKNISKELNVPVVVLAQLNRLPDLRTGHSKGRPVLSDLRESGSIEQDADFVGLLMRDEYYAATEAERAELEGQATLIVAKQRNGPVGDVPLTFLKEFTRFETRATVAE